MAEPWRNRIVRSAEVDPTELLANPNNWRLHPGYQRDALRGSLATVGWVQQVIVNTVTGHMVDGHARVEEALSREERTVPVLYVELSEDEEKLVLATLDPISALAGSDHEKLDELLDEVRVDDEALRKLIGDLASSEPKHGRTDPDDVPDLGESTIKAGDLFALGDHRLLCGDCTDPVMVARLFDGEDADIVWTDPPYGVAIASRIGTVGVSSVEARRLGKDQIENDDMGVEGTRELVANALRIAPLRAGGAFYLASPGGPPAFAFLKALEDVGLRLRQQLIWVKDSLVLTRQDYHWRHEPILYGWRDGAAHHWAGGRDQDTVWEIPRPKRSEEHPTMKPVELVSRSLANSSRKGEVVYDPFVGSGTTIIASEQLGRRCFAMDVDPRYVAVAIERWENFTGRKAEQL